MNKGLGTKSTDSKEVDANNVSWATSVLTPPQKSDGLFHEEAAGERICLWIKFVKGATCKMAETKHRVANLEKLEDFPSALRV